MHESARDQQAAPHPARELVDARVAAVVETIERLSSAMEPDYIVLGGGNATKVGELPPNVRLGANANAFLGGFRLWNPGHSSLAS